jgi:nucleoside 2-deoxyribosyltransferase
MNRVIYITGSSKFHKEVEILSTQFSIFGHIVMGFAVNNVTSYRKLKKEHREAIYRSQLRKIDLADDVHIVNQDGYIGETVRNEIAYAIAKGKKLYFTEETLGNSYLEHFSHEIGQLVAGFVSKN